MGELRRNIKGCCRSFEEMRRTLPKISTVATTHPPLLNQRCHLQEVVRGKILDQNHQILHHQFQVLS